jgi:MFS family permease
MQNSLATFQRIPSDLRLYIWAFGFISFGYFGIFGVLFNLYLLRLGYGPETIGLLVGGGQLLWGLSAIPAGLIGARMGNRNAVILGIAAAAVAIALLLLGEMLPASLQRGWIAAWWMVSWIASALLIVNGTPYVMEVAAPEDRRGVFALQQAFFGLLGFLGSLAAGFLPSMFANLAGANMDSSTVYWCALWLTPLSYAVAVLLMRRTEPRPPIRQETQSSHDSAMPLFIIAFVALIVFLQTAGEGTIRAFFNVYLDTGLQVTTTRIGIVMGLGQVLPVVTSLMAPLLLDRWGAGRTIVFMGAVSGLFMLVLAYFGNWVAASVGYIGVLLTISVSAVARSLFSQEIVAPQWRTTMSAAFTIGLALGWASAAGFGGYLIATFGYRTLFSLGAITAFMSGLLLWGYLRLGTRTKATATVSSA